jgi:hypothetical protein
MRYLSILLLIGVTLKVNGQQINPVPDYIFRNSMSVGRNAPTDTSAYFSIGPRFGATRGFMPPMVIDTAAVTGTKRNGLLIYSIQRNSFLYWDSTGMRWSRIAANLDTLLLSTRAWRQKGDDSLAAIINTRTDTVNLLSTKAWRQKGIDSINAVNASGTGISGYITRWSGTKTMDTSQIFQQANRIGIGNTAPAYILDITGTLRNTGNAFFNTTPGESYFGTTTDNGDFRVQVNGNQYVSGNVGIGNISPGFKLEVTGGIRASENSRINQAQIGLGANNSTTSVAFGVNALVSATTGENGNTAIGRETLRLLTTGTDNVAVGWNAGQQIVSASSNTFVGKQAGNSTTTGGTNTFIGHLAGRDNVLGGGNTYIGNNAGLLQSRGNNNVIIGGLSGSTDSTNNNIWIANGSGTVRIRVDSAGNTGIGQAVPTERLHVNGNILGTGNITTADPSGGTKKPWRLGEAATVSPTSPNRTIRVEIDGVVYYLHAKTTND